MSVERRYRMTRVRAGCYLLPSNDGETIYRIESYIDGPSMGIEEWPRDIKLWGYWKWIGPKNPWNMHPDDDPLDYRYWDQAPGIFNTRREAIEAALQ